MRDETPEEASRSPSAGLRPPLFLLRRRAAGMGVSFAALGPHAASWPDSPVRMFAQMLSAIFDADTESRARWGYRAVV